MALILDETFATGIPGSFATARAQTGTLVATYNAGAQAVDLSNATAGQSIWDITSQSLLSAGEVEIDLEYVSDASGASNVRHAGAWLVAGAAAVTSGVRLVHYQTSWYFSAWGGGVSWAGEGVQSVVGQGDGDTFNTVGDRRVLNIRWDSGIGAGVSRTSIEGRVDGVLRFAAAYLLSPMRPAVHVYQGAVRLHSIKAWDAPQAALTPLDVSRQVEVTGHSNTAPAAPAVAVDRRVVLPNNHGMYSGGTGRIVGTVKERGSPANIPLSRKVVLLVEPGLIPIRVAWSDPVTGDYSFDWISKFERYTVVAFDHTGLYRGVIADGQVPEAMT